ncbi:hypothetical protein EV644_107318 [Kribbella orskensis]|uniref:Uncharacterized protein n=1 Tax=Kribbella orskensis TaxID=2512216 RepID=A0ABY2BJB2_9ACTN|nr:MULTISPECIES: hypothetical protein [Kribbella]TCN39346.1 hypothetical protein EV642_107318 [Kribbella sp. VKM Ac-2500]TCO21993.1 hypothetical protein EV644_107318 [Kribbella orskensis]
MAEQADAAVRISGADHSSWNGHLGVTAPDRKVRGAVTWNNTIEYNDAKVTVPLKEMFDNARVHNQDPETLQSYREAVKTVLHENTHVLAAEGTSHSDAKDAFQNPSVQALEEGVTEVYSYNNLNSYIDDLGLEEIAPGISSAEANRSYKEYAPAAQAFTNGIGRDTGLGGQEVVRRMAVVNAEQKFRVAAETLYDNSDLPGIVPDQEREAALQQIETSMRGPFEPLKDLDKSDDQQLRRASAKAGGLAYDAAVDQVEAIRTQWTAPQHSQRVERQTDRGVQQGAQQSTTNDRAQEQASTGRGSPQSGGDPGQAQRPQELDHAMRAGLSGTAPMSSAKPLGAGEQGSRRSGSQAGQQRQGPERES